ncbi:MAG: hypothetical protein U9Q73_03240 [Nanoarchaeota archaeon]|nr:hypothetical protein [Nanoarchaeota archaeon]
MKKAILPIIVIILLTTLIQARQDPVLLKECVLSYDDDTFAEWDGTKGIVERVTNNNLNFGFGESPNYTYEFYQGNRTYFDESGTYGTTSQLPILEAKSGVDTFAYTKCTFQVGDRFVPYLRFSIYPFYARPTNDFNLTTGIINDSIKIKKTWQTSQYSYSNPPLVVHTVHEDNSLSTNTNEGVFPNTEFYKVYRHKLNDYPSSQVYLDPDFYGEGESRPMAPAFNFYFYINNTNIPNDEIKQYLCPTVSDFTAINFNTSETYPPRFIALPNDEIQMCSTLENNFNTNLENIVLRNSLHSGSHAQGRIGSSATNLSLFHSPLFTTTTNLIPGETKQICDSYTVPEIYSSKQVAIPRIASSYRLYNEKGLLCYQTWPIYGSDNISYLGIKDLTTIIKYNISTKTAIFDVEMGLKVGGASGVSNPNTIVVNPGDYSILTRIYEDNILSENLAMETEIILDQEEFDKIGKANLTKATYNVFNLQFPLLGVLQKTGVKYITKFYTKKLTEPFRDFIIADITGTPYFRPGDIAYHYNNRLNFGLDSKVDSEKIVIFNPTFFENDLELSVGSWSDENNFLLSWDGETFSENASKIVHLYPLQSKEINFWVNATHPFWVFNSREENLKINVSSNLRTESGYVGKDKELIFVLDLDKDNITWFNINPLGFVPEIIFLDNLNSTNNEEITLGWGLGGSDSRLAGLSGSSYEVKVKLINGTDSTGEVLKEINATFIIGETGKMEISFDYDFTYGNYTLVLDLDSNNHLAERYSSGEDAEEDNYNIYSVPFLITSCYYNEDNYMHRINFFGEDVIDKENKCECPMEFVTIPDEGYCADPYSEICSTFITHPICNDWEQSKPGMCGWESRVSPSVNPGDCFPCSNISNTCSGYNNQETCEIDPCYKSLLYDCGVFGCDITQEYGCEWDVGSNRCHFYGHVNGHSCNYFGNVIQECNGTNSEMIINYTSEDVGCDDEIRNVACKQDTVLLSFFSKLSFVLASLMITFFYVLKVGYPLLKKETENSLSKDN